MKRIIDAVAFWRQLSPEIQETLLKRFPLIASAVIGTAVALYFLGQACCCPECQAAGPVAAVVKSCECSLECTCGCNAGLPCACGGDATEAEVDFGVSFDKISDEPRYSISGRECSREEVLAALKQQAAGKVPDYAGRLRLTIIGPEADRKKVIADLTQPPLQQLVGALVVKDYAPDHWAVAGSGFVTTGRPTIYLQTPDGTVLHRSDSYDGPQALAEAVRRARDDYDSKKDPNLSRGGGDLVSRIKTAVAKIPVPAWVLAALGGVFMLLNKRKTERD